MVTLLYFAEQEVMKVMKLELSHLALGVMGTTCSDRGTFSPGKRWVICLHSFYSVLGSYKSIWIGKIIMSKVWQLLHVLAALWSTDPLFLPKEYSPQTLVIFAPSLSEGQV